MAELEKTRISSPERTLSNLPWVEVDSDTRISRLRDNVKSQGRELSHLREMIYTLARQFDNHAHVGNGVKVDADASRLTGAGMGIEVNVHPAEAYF